MFVYAFLVNTMRPQHNLASAATMKQKMAQKPCLHEVNKHFKPFFNDVFIRLVVMLRPHNIKS